jgi:hypothetical protein
MLDGDHTDLHHRFLQFAKDAGLESESIGEAGAERVFGEAAAELSKRLVEHGFAHDQFPDEVDDIVDLVGVDAEEIGAFGRGAVFADRGASTRG